MDRSKRCRRSSGVDNDERRTIVFRIGTEVSIHMFFTFSFSIP